MRNRQHLSPPFSDDARSRQLGRRFAINTTAMQHKRFRSVEYTGDSGGSWFWRRKRHQFVFYRDRSQKQLA
jgi:hypothetical protein